MVPTHRPWPPGGTAADGDRGGAPRRGPGFAVGPGRSRYRLGARRRCAQWVQRRDDHPSAAGAEPVGCSGRHAGSRPGRSARESGRAALGRSSARRWAGRRWGGRLRRGARREHWHLALLSASVSYTHLRAHETVLDLVCRLLLEKKKNNKIKTEPRPYTKQNDHNKEKEENNK